MLIVCCSFSMICLPALIRGGRFDGLPGLNESILLFSTACLLETELMVKRIWV